MNPGRTILCPALAFALLVPGQARGQPPEGDTPEGVSTPEASAAPSDPACVPTCREGYTCVEGDCVSACNPPCDPGQVCTADGQCHADSASSTVVIVPPTANACVSDAQCRHPRTCELGQCQITSTYLAALLSESRTATIVGAVMMSVGAVLMLASSGAYAAGMAKKRRGESDDDDYRTGTIIAGVGLGVLVTGTIPLGVGLSKRRRWKAYSSERVTAP